MLKYEALLSAQMGKEFTPQHTNMTCIVTVKDTASIFPWV